MTAAPRSGALDDHASAAASAPARAPARARARAGRAPVGPRSSPQQVDPLGATGARPLTLAAGGSALLLGVVATLVGAHQLSGPASAMAALVLVAAAGLVLWLASSPARAPFPGIAVVAVVLCGAGATVASAHATWGANVGVRDDWTPFALGVLVLGLAPYRRAGDLLLAGAVLATVVGAVTLAQAPGFAAPVPEAVFVVVAVTPVLALSVGGAVFSGTFVRSVEDWRDRAGRQRAETTTALRDPLARSVQQDRVTVLNRDAVPFFADLLRRGEVAPVDVVEARRVGDALRSTLVAEADRSWLEELLTSPRDRASGRVDDPDGAAATLPRDRRTVVRALLVALGDSEVVDGRDLLVELRARDGRADVVVSAPTTEPEALVRARLEPWSAVLRVVFHDARVDASGSPLTLRFSYDQH